MIKKQQQICAIRGNIVVGQPAIIQTVEPNGSTPWKKTSNVCTWFGRNLGNGGIDITIETKNTIYIGYNIPQF